MDLSDSVALVTGGSGGLGGRICLALASAGANVAVGYAGGEDRAGRVSQEVIDQGRRAIPVKVDLSDPTAIEAAVETVVSELGALDILINNAGVAAGGYSIEPGDLESFTPEIWDELMALNVRGPYLLTRAAAKALRASALGRVVNVGSTIGVGSFYADRIFHPSKAAVVPLTRFLASSLAPDVTVNAVLPGLMLGTGLGGDGQGAYADVWRDRALCNETTSLDDVANQVIAFCESSTITGQSLVIDGGINFQ
jgi:3-oxoacyl-[acyl-carrier protein] reductase